MHGTIEMRQDEVASFTYTPDNSGTPLPLHAASSMITELAPFVILIKNNRGVGQIIFEEPEAHLHLSAQRSMARALARLVNSGTHVLVTSHSDTFVQQINNLIILYNHRNKDRLMTDLGYEKEDLINPQSARAYEFVEQGTITTVCDLPITPDGFIVPSLNETLLHLARETIKLQED
jgi:hypothetical protein